jgi:hypothetical protein
MINSASTANDHDFDTNTADFRREDAPDSSTDAGESGLSVAALVDGMRKNNRILMHQSERIEELQSVLSCILYLTGKVRNLERENDC